MPSKKFGLPVLRRIKLTAFSLYKEKREIALDIPDGVLCLVGANGIGKSTFVSAVNFGLCGRVAEPGRRFQSSDEYFQHVRDFSATYFDGRIDGWDKEEAEIEIEFTIGNDKYQIVRGAFEPDQLRYASLNGRTFDGNPPTINDQYKVSVAKSVKVSSFEQFAFLQLFIFTFDEQRHLTFWESPIQSQLLLLAFGRDATEAQQAEELQRRADRLESVRRNINYQANETRKRLQIAQRVLSGLSPEVIDLQAEQERLESDLDDLCRRESDALTALSDSKLKSSELRSRALVTKEEIDYVFAQRTTRTSDLSIRPIVADSLMSGSCHLCGASGSHVLNGITDRISRHDCPLCGVELPTHTLAEEAIQEIAELDDELSRLNASIQEEVDKQNRTQLEVDRVQASIAQQQRLIASFENEHRELSRSIGTTDVGELQRSIQSNQRAIRELNAAKDKARQDRDKARADLKQMQYRVSQQYAEGENEFLGIFKDLAERFIGLDVYVRFDVRGTEIRLVLEIEGQPRRRDHQLSESQRFFVDIALRMAVVAFVASHRGGSLLIDTPEGSLDIAYESRAGQMFARFIENGSQLVMTANINTSRLLLDLAKECSAEKMRLERMTEWTTLSEVQSASQHLFEDAFDRIEEALGSGNHTGDCDAN